MLVIYKDYTEMHGQQNVEKKWLGRCAEVQISFYSLEWYH